MALASKQTSNQVFSCRGPLILPVALDFRTLTTIEVDLTEAINNAQIDFISNLYINTIGLNETFELISLETKQVINIPANSQGYYPLMTGQFPKFQITVSALLTDILIVQFSNIPFVPFTNSISGQAVDIVSVGGTPVTDPLPVDIGAVGTLDVNVSQFGGVAAIQPLTDAELRALPVDVDTGEVFQGAYTDRSIANLSGASEQLMAANANRRVMIVQNVGATDIAINLTGATAAINTAGSITLGSGSSITIDNFPPTSAINIIGTLNADVTAYEG